MYRGDDILKIYDEDGNEIGRETRETVHRQGLLHVVAHVWMFEENSEGLNIFFQKRSAGRELYPGKYDLVQTTHFDPDEGLVEGVLHAMDYYLGTKVDPENAAHIGSLRQHIDQGDYHDNALVQVFSVRIKKALFVLPDAEDIVKARFEDFADFVHGRKDSIPMYSADGLYISKSFPDDWWLRKEEFLEVVEPYIRGALS
ncbi:MAG: hypothetical protein K5637_08780 [Lachnospiraceae bacterium]|nr:hypothetical protein [Lachnospiraceae bacterium]